MNSDKPEAIDGVQNPSLIRAIRDHFENNSNETYDELFDQLRNASFLVALLENNLKTEEGVAQEGSNFSIALIEDNAGKMLLPIFTDWIHLNESAPGKDGIVLDSDWAFSMAIENYDGVVINHTGMALPIYNEFLKKITGEGNA